MEIHVQGTFNIHGNIDTIRDVGEILELKS
jgi:hypothetical protein